VAGSVFIGAARGRVGGGHRYRDLAWPGSALGAARPVHQSACVRRGRRHQAPAEHLGPSQREWARDLGRYPETDDYIEPIAEGVDAELEHRDFPEMMRQRDDLLVQLLAAKKSRSQIP
jgi:hypothetical protein